MLPHALTDRFLRRISTVQDAGLKSFGLLVADPGDPSFPHRPVDVVFVDPSRNRRNESAIQAAFRAQGSYLRTYDDAGFVADPAEVMAVDRELAGARGSRQSPCSTPIDASWRTSHR
jgi:hypothetical protein